MSTWYHHGDLESTFNHCIIYAHCFLVKCAWNTPAFFAEKLHKAMKVFNYDSLFLSLIHEVWIHLALNVRVRVSAQLYQPCNHPHISILVPVLKNEILLTFVLVPGPRHMWGYADQDSGESLWDWPEENHGWIQGHVWRKPPRRHTGMTKMHLCFLKRKTTKAHHYISVLIYALLFTEWH